ncbi:putative Ig domain-containing protein, partial [Curtobacterium sp. ME26]|uniref:putative Ig domain-containing protein n=1 Tax=Curtobacterium sp. ME26 TaxID=2744254 RepID=UPI002174D95A
MISGTPTTAGRSTFTITATNSAGSDEHEFVLTTAAAAATVPAITTTSVPDATVGSTYRAVVAATGTGPIRYAVTSGTLPAGLSLDAVSGVISGTPTTAGRSTFTITATNSAGSDEHEFVLTTAAA